MDYKSIIENALRDYLNWVSSGRCQRRFYKEAELIGIFYNKLVTRLREGGLDIGKFRRSIYPDDLHCVFRTPGYIERVSINPIPLSYNHHSPERTALLMSLAKAMDQIGDVDVLNSFTWKLTEIVNSIKKL